MILNQVESFWKKGVNFKNIASLLKRITIVLLLLSIEHKCNSQEIFSWTKETAYCNPSVVGLPRAKALILKYELQPEYKIISTAKQGNYGNSEAKINRNRRWIFACGSR